MENVFLSHYRSLESRVEGWIPWITAGESLGFAAGVLVWQACRQSLLGTTLAGSYFLWAMYLKSREAVTPGNVEERSAKLLRDVRYSVADATFDAKKLLYFQRFRRVSKVLQTAAAPGADRSLEEVGRVLAKSAPCLVQRGFQTPPARAASPRGQFLRDSGSPLLKSREAIALSQRQAMNTLAHGMRTSLGTAINSLSLIEKAGLSSAQLELLSSSEREAGAALRQFNEYFESANRDQECILQMKRFLIADLKAHLMEKLSAAAKAKGVKFECLLAEDLPLQAVSDRQKILQILMNFAEAAIQNAAPNSTVSIKVRKEVGSIHDYIRFDLTGGKMVGDQESTSGGFMISRRLVQLMNGCISPKNEPSKFMGADSNGTRVWFLVPLKTDVYVPIMPLAPLPVNFQRALRVTFPAHDSKEAHAVGAAAAAPVKVRVLLLDDDVGTLKLYKKMLEDQGYAVDTAENIKTACELVKARPYYLAILDYHLKDGETGAVAAVEIAKIRPGQLMVGASAGADIPTRELFLQAGVKQVWQKPLTRPVLPALLKSL